MIQRKNNVKTGFSNKKRKFFWFYFLKFEHVFQIINRTKKKVFGFLNKIEHWNMIDCKLL